MDDAALSIQCPKCARTLTSRRMHEHGLACDCGATLHQLAVECSRRWQPLSYLFVDRQSGKVKYVGTTRDLYRRMAEHCVSNKLLFARETVGGGKSRLRQQPIETTLQKAGVRVHVALHASEWHLWSSLWYKPDWNVAPPPASGATYRSLRRTADGGAEAVTYTSDACKHQHAEALHLANVSARRGHMAPPWTATWPMRIGAIDEMLGEVEMPGVGRLSASRTTAIDGKTQYEWALRRLDKTTTAGSWPVLRQGECEKLGFFGYCLCRVPCGQRWVLVGEPEERMRLREESRFAEWADPWRKHGVMGTDDEEVMDKLDVAMEIEEESERLRVAGKPSKKRWSELTALTKEITELRARQVYGDGAASFSRMITLNWRHVYMRDRNVRRVGNG